MRNPPVLWDIESDPALAGTKLIAEAWDAAGLYQVGSFIGNSWKEWNGRFRDDVRSFCRGDEGSLTRFADRLVGSPAIYGHKEREAEQSVNFVTCHDGFTLNDLVSYDHKHNEENGDSEPENQRVSLNQLLRGANSAWHGVKLGQPDWSATSHSIAFTVEIRREKTLVHLILNGYWRPLDFEWPRLDSEGEYPWRRWIDTSLDSPRDIVEWETAQSVPGYAYRTEARSVVLLFARA
jgi:pullulanase/glycogen debranching enzyme